MTAPNPVIAVRFILKENTEASGMQVILMQRHAIFPHVGGFEN